MQRDLPKHIVPSSKNMQPKTMVSEVTLSDINACNHLCTWKVITIISTVCITQSKGHLSGCLQGSHTKLIIIWCPYCCLLLKHSKRRM